MIRQFVVYPKGGGSWVAPECLAAPCLRYRVERIPGLRLGAHKLRGPDHQYLIRRSIDKGELAFYHCYNPNHAHLGELVYVAGARWPIEEFGSAKNEVGLDDYQVRTWDASHRHVTLAMLAHTFLEYYRARSGVLVGACGGEVGSAGLGCGRGAMLTSAGPG